MVCPAPSFDIDIGVSEHLKDKQRFRIVLEIFSDEEEEDSPYDFDISLVGFFSVTGVDMLKEQIPLYYRNGVMILYSAAREIIAATTARGPFPAFILPTMTFDLSNRTWVKMAKAEAKARELIEQKKTRQLPSAVKKPAKKKASKRGAKI
jgi:preprotein translocase subunit SecB